MAEAARNHWANRLIGENSPYLLQHAHNPVDWYPWGAEAFARARAENKPVFLSIGYAACHWCHVMERESFENESIAAYLNQHFISIKVDREERPDIDAIYMQALQLMSGQGGWPMSMFLTPDGKPFYGGTYFPPEDHFGRPGFAWILEQIVSAWRDQAQEIADSGAAIIDAVVREPNPAPGGREPPAPEAVEELISRALMGLMREYDSAWGGFGDAPKFPMTMALDLLLRSFARTKNPEYLNVVENTLDKMSRGGIYDHIGGGFHRYSIDRDWLVPHFEKMLYDNALLVPLYLDMYRINGKPHWLQVASDTLDWVLREMTDRAGGFYATLDADSGGSEGAFYVWKSWEIDAALGPQDAALFKEYYDASEIGNWTDRRGANILNVRVPLEHFAPMKHIDPDELGGRLDGMRKKLRAARDRRPRSALDDKVIVAWNGMMISALAHGAQVTGNEKYARAARAAADFILQNVRGENGELLHVWRAGRAGFSAYLDDYAFLVLGLTDLYETTFDPALLDEARLLAEEMIARFQDAMRGGFYTTDGRDPTAVARIKDFNDGSIPSGNSAAAMVLARLGMHMRCDDWRDLARQIVNAAPRLAERPLGHLALLAAAAFDIAPPCEIAIAGDLDDPAARDLIDVVWKRYIPARVLAAGPEGSVELLNDRKPVQGKPTAYVCRGQTCGEPARTRDELINQL